MQNSQCNNGSLGLTYLTTLPRPNDLELFSQNLVAEVPDFGHKLTLQSRAPR